MHDFPRSNPSDPHDAVPTIPTSGDSPRLPSEDLPPIVVGILSYNRCADVIATIDIIRQSDYPADRMHIVVIDNASIDDTPRRIRERFGEEVEVIALTENRGAVARNMVMLGRTESYIFCFDDDAAPEFPSTIRRSVEYLEAHPRYGGLCFISRNIDSRRPEFGDMGMVSRRRLPEGRYEGMYVVGPGMCFRREAIQRTEGYDEHLFWGAEEHGLALEMLYHDIPLVLDPGCSVLHRRGVRALAPAHALEIDTRNNIWIAFRYFPLPLALLVAFLQTGRRLASAAIKEGDGRVGAVLSGTRLALRDIGDVIRRRHPIPVARIARHNRWFFHMFYALPSRSSRTVRQE